MSDALHALRQQLEERLSALADIDESEPNGVGVDHIELERIGEHTEVEKIAKTICTPDELERMERPDRSERERVARALSVKEACAKALGTGFSEQLDWTDLEIPRVSSRPFRVHCDRRFDAKIYAASAVSDGRAIAVAATFEP